MFAATHRLRENLLNITLRTITLDNSLEAAARINENFRHVEAAFKKALSLRSTVPNQLESSWNLAGNELRNAEAGADITFEPES